MKISVISDTHSLHPSINMEKAINSDVLIHCGDFSNNGSLKEVVRFLGWFSNLREELNITYLVLIAGNHDKMAEADPHQFKQLMPDNVIYLENSGVDILGYKFWGSPMTPTFFDWFFMEERGQALGKYWDLIPRDADVLITHGPPYGILDISGLQNVGCESLRYHIDERLDILLHCFGHIHPCAGSVVVDGVEYINGAIVSDNHQVIGEPIVTHLPDRIII